MMETLTSQTPVRAPDLVASRGAGGIWRVEGLSQALAHWTGLVQEGAAGRMLKELFQEVSPGLDYLADEVLASERPLRDITVHFIAPADCYLLAEVLEGGLHRDYHERQVHFYFRPLPVGQGRQHPPAGQFGLVGVSPGMQEVYRKIALYAASDAAVVVTGETGTGKELVARALHEQSARRGRAFVAVNCSAISSGLLNSDLFGP